MINTFRVIGLTGKPRHPAAFITHKLLYHWLTEKNYKVIVDHTIAKELNIAITHTASLYNIGQSADLVIVIGGDGNMLGAARTLARSGVKVIGVNRGNLGFLTDLNPDNVQQQLSAVLAGEYIEEQRFLLEVSIYHDKQLCQQASAINEIVLHPGKVAHMIEFEVYIDQRFAFSQRSDGLIISTPTGSTAYSLSAGGPILMPTLEAINLVPMFPHTLTSRPIVINSNSEIKLKCQEYTNTLEVSCDGQVHHVITANDEVIVKRCPCQLNLIHPKDHNYFNVLSTKLGWAKKLV